MDEPLDEEAQLHTQLAQIRERFLQHTRDEIPALLELLSDIRSGDSCALVRLQTLAHRIHGSGAIFNFTVISERAGQLEHLLGTLIGSLGTAAIEGRERQGVLEGGKLLAHEIGAARIDEPAADE